MAAREKVAIIGGGVVGCALGRLLRLRGYTIVAVASRSLASARRAARFIGGRTKWSTDSVKAIQQASIILITTPDRAIANICRTLVRAGLPKRVLILHTSGFFSSRILYAARSKGAAIGSIHPLQSFASPQIATELIPGTYFGWEGSPGSRSRILRMIRSLKGHPLEIRPVAKPLYHAAAVFVSNYAVTLFSDGVELLEKVSKAKVKRRNAGKALMPLLMGTISNLAELGLPKALTGPIARGDVSVVAGHLKAFQKDAKDFLPLYRLLGRHTIPIGVRKGQLLAAEMKKLKKLL